MKNGQTNKVHIVTLKSLEVHYRKKYDKYMNFSTGWYACKVFLPPLGAIILNFSTMVQLTL